MTQKETNHEYSHEENQTQKILYTLKLSDTNINVSQNI